MKILTVIVSIFLCMGLLAQDPTHVDAQYPSSQLKSITKVSNLVIAYRHYSYWNQETPWQILAVDSKNIITKYNANTWFANLNKLSFSQDSLKKELNLFYQYDIFSMNGTQNWFATCDSCSTMIYDGDEYSFLIFTKNEFFNLYFYEPGYHVTCCSRLFGHEKIVDLIKELFSR